MCAIPTYSLCDLMKAMNFDVPFFALRSWKLSGYKEAELLDRPSSMMATSLYIIEEKNVCKKKKKKRV